VTTLAAVVVFLAWISSRFWSAALDADATRS
jgi:hypothetical protein